MERSPENRTTAWRGEIVLTGGSAARSQQARGNDAHCASVLGFHFRDRAGMKSHFHFERYSFKTLKRSALLSFMEFTTVPHRLLSSSQREFVFLARIEQHIFFKPASGLWSSFSDTSRTVFGGVCSPSIGSFCRGADAHQSI